MFRGARANDGRGRGSFRGDRGDRGSYRGDRGNFRGDRGSEGRGTGQQGIEIFPFVFFHASHSKSLTISQQPSSSESPSWAGRGRATPHHKEGARIRQVEYW